CVELGPLEPAFCAGAVLLDWDGSLGCRTMDGVAADSEVLGSCPRVHTAFYLRFGWLPSGEKRGESVNKRLKHNIVELNQNNIYQQKRLTHTLASPYSLTSRSMRSSSTNENASTGS